MLWTDSLVYPVVSTLNDLGQTVNVHVFDALHIGIPDSIIVHILRTVDKLQGRGSNVGDDIGVDGGGLWIPQKSKLHRNRGCCCCSCWCSMHQSRTALSRPIRRTGGYRRQHRPDPWWRLRRRQGWWHLPRTEAHPRQTWGRHCRHSTRSPHRGRSLPQSRSCRAGRPHSCSRSQGTGAAVSTFHRVDGPLRALSGIHDGGLLIEGDGLAGNLGYILNGPPVGVGDLRYLRPWWNSCRRRAGWRKCSRSRRGKLPRH